ncbi:SI1L3 protein, partial [Molothrus ater]|nr:SI1L3 protein [Molothrus ater]
MGVRARVAEWPPRSKEYSGNSRHFQPSQSSFKPFHRRLIPHLKDLEFQEGFLGIPLRQRSSSEVTLSECDPEEIPEIRGNSSNSAGLFREYGSTSSIDVQGIPEQSFFEMLNEFRTKKPQNPDQNPEQPQPQKEKRRRCLKPDDSIFKKLLNPKDPEDPKLPEPPKSWICRKSFAHFDVQSIFFEAVSVGSAGTRRRNTTTGASAASAASHPPNFSSLENLNSKENLEEDLGDNTSNDLLLSCPHFRNEIGGGRGERDVSFSKSAFSSSAAAAAAPSGILGESGNFWKVSNAGVSVLEFPKEEQRNPERVGSFSVEHADLGATYYRDYFHGREHSNYFGLDEKLGPVAVSVRRE